jgi:hypothetical protein
MRESSIAAWAQEQFGRADLGDVRRLRRLIDMAAGAARCPSGKVSVVFRRACEREGAYDFLESPHVEASAVAQAMFSATVERTRGNKAVYVVLDISMLTLTDEAEAKGFGVLGASNRPVRGLCVMNALAVDVEGVPLGLLDQQYWAREFRRTGTKDERNAMNLARPFEDKQPAYFVRAAERVIERLSGSGVIPWFVIDREGDCRDIFRELSKMPCLMTIRGTKNRRLSSASDEEHVRESLLREPPLGTHAVELARNGKRPARVATVEVRAKPVELRFHYRPGEEVELHRMHAVWVRERGATENALDWMLYTNAPITSQIAALKIVNAYRARWRIEEFHRTWKRGECNVETAQLRSFDAMVKWSTVLSAVAIRIERLKYISRAMPDVPATVELAPIEIEALKIERRSQGLRGTKARIPETLTIAQATSWIAEMGGWMGLKSSGPPGSQTIARGLERLSIFVAAIEAVRNQDSPRKRRK